MDESERKENILQRKATKVVKQMRAAEEKATTPRPRIYLTIGPKGGLARPCWRVC